VAENCCTERHCFVARSLALLDLVDSRVARKGSELLERKWRYCAMELASVASAVVAERNYYSQPEVWALGEQVAEVAHPVVARKMQEVVDSASAWRRDGRHW
jgi:hypothetical protein